MWARSCTRTRRIQFNQFHSLATSAQLISLPPGNGTKEPVVTLFRWEHTVLGEIPQNPKNGNRKYKKIAIALKQALKAKVIKVPIELLPAISKELGVGV